MSFKGSDGISLNGNGPGKIAPCPAGDEPEKRALPERAFSTHESVYGFIQSAVAAHADYNVRARTQSPSLVNEVASPGPPVIKESMRPNLLLAPARISGPLSGGESPG